MEGVLARLLLPDSSEIAAATADLRTAFKQPGAIAELCGVLSTSQQPQIRQYGAVLLRYIIIVLNIASGKASHCHGLVSTKGYLL